MPKMRMQRKVHGFTMNFDWWGGEYIEVSFRGRACHDVINTTVEAELIPFTRDNMRREVDEWIETADENDLLEVLRYG